MQAPAGVFPLLLQVWEEEQAYPSAQVSVGTVSLVEAILPLHHHTQVLVVQDHHLHFQLLDGGCGQLLAVHQETAIAINVYNNLSMANMSEFAADDQRKRTNG